VQLVRDTQLIVLNVEDTNPVQAAQIANAIAQVFAEQTQSLQTSRYAASKESLSNQLDDVELQIEQTSAALAAISLNSVRAEDQAERIRLEATLTQYRQVYANLLQSYEQVRLAESSSTSNVVVVEPATVPEGTVRPRALMNTALASVVGLMLAVGMVFMMEALDDTLRSPDDITRQLGLPILGLVATHEVDLGAPIAASQPRSPVSEAFRSLRTNIQFASVDRPIRSLLVTSPSPTDGKSTIAANLGVVIAQSGRKAVMLDADMRRPRVHKMFGLTNRSGLSGLFVQPQIVLDGALQKTQVADLFALTTGDIPPNPAELLSSEKMLQILRELNGQVDTIVIDSPPVTAVTDAAVLAPRVDGVLLVVKPGITKLDAAKQAVEQLRRVGANLIGVVLNEVDMRRSRYNYGYYKGYYYHYAYGGYYGEDGQKSSRKHKAGKKKPQSKVVAK